MKSKVTILGAGESGTGAAILAKKQGFEVFVSDAAHISDKYKNLLNSHNIAFEEGSHSFDKVLESSEIIKSPGVPNSAKIIIEAKAKGISVISEIEFASRFTNAKIIGITGSNGKTTTTLLTYHLFKEAGYRVGLAGNIGNSFSMQVAEKDFDWFVIELSSFQLDDIKSFTPYISVILNITPDHLDRYNNSFSEYAEAKFNIIGKENHTEHLIYCADDPSLVELVQKYESELKNTQLWAFSAKKTDKVAAYIEHKKIVIPEEPETLIIDPQTMILTGTHNVYNTMAASIAARLSEIRNEAIRSSLTSFTAVPHRLEPVLQIRGVKFINDSKATNINAVWYALESMQTNVVWIAGGVDKGNDYSELNDLVQEKVRTLICLGKDTEKLKKAYGKTVEILEAQTMEEAVKKAYAAAHKTDCVLLSPACASFDLFDNYIDRGDKFKEAVRRL